MKISQLLKFISDSSPQNTPARLAFYNYLKNRIFLDDRLSAEVVNGFVACALDYPHWQQNKSQLSKELKYLLENFDSSYKNSDDYKKVVLPAHTQVIELESFDDVTDALMSYCHIYAKEGEQFKIYNDQNRRAIALTLHKDESITLRCFDKKFTVRKGQLEPLRTDLALYYDANFSLKPNLIQTVEVSPYIWSQFYLHKEKVSGSVIRGYVFQRFQDIRSTELEQEFKLFSAIKKIELCFVNKEDDPFYLGLVTKLKKSLDLRPFSSEDLLSQAQKHLNSAIVAYEDLFIGDKTLASLIKDLTNALNNPRSLDLVAERESEQWQATTPMARALPLLGSTSS